MIAALIAEDGPLDPANMRVGIYTAIVDNGLTTVLDDLTLAPGSLATPLTFTAWSEPYVMTDGRRVVDSEALVFRPASGADFCVVIGWYLALDGTPDVLLLYNTMAESVNLPSTDSQMTLIVRFTLDPLGRWGAEAVING